MRLPALGDIKKCQAVFRETGQEDGTSAEHQRTLINATFYPLWTAGTFNDTFIDALASHLDSVALL